MKAMVTKERQAELARAHYVANKDSYKAAASAWKKRNRPATRLALRRWRLKKMGHTIASAATLLEKQQGRCAICTALLVLTRGPNMACLDHNHITGEARGYLCNCCNRAIGLLKDSPEILRSAANYLEKHQWR